MQNMELMQLFHNIFRFQTAARRNLALIDRHRTRKQTRVKPHEGL